MLVTQFMTREPVTVTTNTTIAEAWKLLKEFKVRHLPVVEAGGKIRGMVSDRDIRSAGPSHLLSDVEHDACLSRLMTESVGSIMTAAVGVLTVEATLDDALFLFDREKVGALPVIDSGEHVIGILSIRDLLRAYRRLFGLAEKGSFLIEVIPDQNPHPMSRIVRVLEDAGISFSRLMYAGAEAAPGGQPEPVCFIRVHTFNRTQVVKKLEQAGFQVR